MMTRLLACMLVAMMESSLFANAGYFGGSGHTIELSHSDQIQMVSEEVTITPLPGFQSELDQVEYRCRFVLKNLSPTATTIQVGFPLDGELVEHSPEEKILRIGYVLPLSAGIASTVQRQVALSKDAEFKPGRTGVLRIANVTADGHLDLEDVRYIHVSDKHRARLDLKAGDLLFNWRNSPKWVGKTAFVASDLEHTFASFLYRLRVLPSRADSHFVWLYLNFLRGRGVFEAMCRQAVSQANLGRDELASVGVMVPPLERQKTFAKLCVDFWSAEAQQLRATSTAELAFQSLLAGVFGEGA